MNDKPDHTSVQVEIFGNEYTIKGVAHPEYIKDLAQFVDSKMREITENTATISSTKVAILAALNIADELYQIRGQIEVDEKNFNQKSDQLLALINRELGKEPHPPEGI